ncbi:hypothetical protein MLD38_028852 [Melastoma candidum]|uniref:Uncharacterized protein n=1 Tax=Melastoma candidum TaxID=119954 RepID=A0ACB9N7Y9_9MYRT|nr:hypothetical protein MLD38_028852 [Melastoma candidum]
MASSSSSLLPPHSAIRFADIFRNDTRRFRIPRSVLALSPSACCGARFRPTLLNHRGLSPFPDGLGQRVQRWTWDEKGRRKKKGADSCDQMCAHCRGEYGAWAAFLALLILLFF